MNMSLSAIANEVLSSINDLGDGFHIDAELTITCSSTNDHAMEDTEQTPVSGDAYPISPKPSELVSRDEESSLTEGSI